MRLYLLIGAIFLLAACTLGGASTEGDGVCSAEERFAGNSDDCIADFIVQEIFTFVSVDDQGNQGLEVQAVISNAGGNFEGNVPVGFVLSTDGSAVVASSEQSLEFTGGNERLDVDFEVSEGVFNPVISYQEAQDGIAYATYFFDNVDVTGQYNVLVSVNTGDQVLEKDYTNNQLEKGFEFVPEPVAPQFLIEEDIGDNIYQGSYISKQVNDDYDDYYSAYYQSDRNYVSVNINDLKGRDAQAFVDRYLEWGYQAEQRLGYTVYISANDWGTGVVWPSGDLVVSMYLSNNDGDDVFEEYIELHAPTGEAIAGFCGDGIVQTGEVCDQGFFSEPVGSVFAQLNEPQVIVIDGRSAEIEILGGAPGEPGCLDYQEDSVSLRVTNENGFDQTQVFVEEQLRIMNFVNVTMREVYLSNIPTENAEAVVELIYYVNTGGVGETVVALELNEPSTWNLNGVDYTLEIVDYEFGQCLEEDPTTPATPRIVLSVDGERESLEPHEFETFAGDLQVFVEEITVEGSFGSISDISARLLVYTDDVINQDRLDVFERRVRDATLSCDLVTCEVVANNAYWRSADIGVVASADGDNLDFVLTNNLPNSVEIQQFSLNDGLDEPVNNLLGQQGTPSSLVLAAGSSTTLSYEEQNTCGVQLYVEIVYENQNTNAVYTFDGDDILLEISC